VPLVRDDHVEHLLDETDQERIEEIYTDEAVQFIRSSKDRPFFLYFPHTAVHTPIHPGKAFQGTALESLSKFLSGPSALVYGGESVVALAREIVAWAKDKDSLKFKAAILDGITFEGKAGVEALSQYPTREEAQAKVVTLVLSPGRKLLGAVKGPGGRVMGIVKEIERKLEAGETIAAKA
jgi:hypothetical protein